MQQWWEGLEQLYQMLRDADALGLSREARRRLVEVVGALDSALLNCAKADCPIRSTVVESYQGLGKPRGEPAGRPAQTSQPDTGAATQTCRNCRWWNQQRRDAADGEGTCLLTRTESNEGGRSQPLSVNTLARASASDLRVGAVLVTQVPYACSQWTPLP